jgi:hypothetical protein
MGAAALEYYLTAFDEDFTQRVQRRRRRPIKNQTPQFRQPASKVDPLAVLAMTKPKLPPPPTGHKIKDIRRPPTTGWDDKMLTSGFSAIGDKPLEKWTRLDLRRYVAHIYNLRWGDTLPMRGEYALINEIIVKIEHCFRTQIGQEGNSILKEYFDFFVETQVPDAAREKGGLNWRKFSYTKYIIAFVKHWKAKQVAPVAPEPVAEPLPQAPAAGLDAASVQAAYRKAPVVFVREFGVIVTINYLVMVKKQTLDKAIAYAKTALEKIAATSPGDLKEVRAATERHQPYPKWLSFVDVSGFAELFGGEAPSITLGENAGFGFMKDTA